MEFGEFVVAHIKHRVAVLCQLGDDLAFLSLTFRELDAHKNMRGFRIGIAVVKFGDRTSPEQLDEGTVAARFLRDRHRQQCLAMLADFSPFGNMAEPVEIHVGTAVDRYQRASSLTTSLSVS